MALRLQRAVFLILFFLFAVSRAALAQDEGADPRALLAEAVDQLQQAESFKLSISQSGRPYPLELSFDGVNFIRASLESAAAQYLKPDELYISALLRIVVPLSLDIYSLDDRQWISFPSGAPWFMLPAFEGFAVNRLLASDDGLEYLVENLQEPRLVEDGATVNGSAAWHIQATTAGNVVSSLLFGFIQPSDDVRLDAYINSGDGLLASMDITMLEPAADPAVEAAVWHISFTEYDAPRDFAPPSP